MPVIYILNKQNSLLNEPYISFDKKYICVTKDGRTLLVEFNDAYSLGAYGLADIYYAKLISARWSQLLGVKDEYHF